MENMTELMLYPRGRSEIRDYVDIILRNEVFVDDCFDNKRGSAIYKKWRKSGKLTCRIIAEKHYNGVRCEWEKIKTLFLGYKDKIIEEIGDKYEETCKKIKSIENEEDWKLAKWYVQFKKVNKHAPYKFKEEFEESFKGKINQEYLKLYEKWLGLDDRYKEAKNMTDWVAYYENEVKKFLSGKVVATKEEFLEELSKLKKEEKQNKKIR